MGSAELTALHVHVLLQADKLIETKGLDYVDRERAKCSAPGYLFALKSECHIKRVMHTATSSSEHHLALRAGSMRRRRRCACTMSSTAMTRTCSSNDVANHWIASSALVGETG